jgi:hypothetical protein
MKVGNFCRIVRLHRLVSAVATDTRVSIAGTERSGYGMGTTSVVTEYGGIVTTIE